MKTIIRKIAVCFLLIACIVKSYGQSDSDRENLYYTEFEKVSAGRGTSNWLCGDDYFLLTLYIQYADTRQYAFYEGGYGWNNFVDKAVLSRTSEPVQLILDGAAGDEDNDYHSQMKRCQYSKGMGPQELAISAEQKRGTCVRSINAKYKVTVYDPVPISSYLFDGTSPQNMGSNQTCGNTPITINIGSYYASGTVELQIWAANNQWKTIDYLLNTSPKTYNYNDLSSYINYGKGFHFRTRRTLPDGNYSYYTFPNTPNLYYNRPYELPAGTKLEWEIPQCQDNGIALKIPYSTHPLAAPNYIPNDVVSVYLKSSYGKPEGGPLCLLNATDLENTPMTQINGNYISYYIITHNALKAGEEYVMTLERNNTCLAKINFTIPELPQFEVSPASYPDKLDAYEIPKTGNRGRVKFFVSGSRSPDITVTTDANTFNRSLTNTTVIEDITFYSDSVTIDLPAGKHNISISNGICSYTYPQQIELIQPAPVSCTTAFKSPSCAAQQNLVAGNTKDGKIILSDIKGGIKPYRYRINNEDLVNLSMDVNEIVIDTLQAKRYTVVVEDAVGNSVSTGVQIRATGISIAKKEASSPSLSCLSDGEIKITATGGTGQLTYSRENNNYSFDTNNALTGYSHGQAVFYVKDSCNCVIKDSVEVLARPALSVYDIAPIPPTCPGGNDGKCTLYIANRQGDLSVSAFAPGIIPDSISIAVINNVSATVTVKGLSSGTYFCILKDQLSGKSCISDTIFFTIPEKPAISITSIVTPVSNKGSSTGKIAVHLSGGNSGAYQVILSGKENNPQTTPGSCLFENLTGVPDNGKLYTISVTDSKGCLKDTTVYLPEPQDSLLLIAVLTKPISCHGHSDAVITLSATGGWGEYEYSQDSITWNTQTTLTNYSSGTYKFYVRDKYNGTATAILAIAEPQPLNITAHTVTEAACFGSATGTIRFRVAGGTAPYSLTPALGTVSAVTENDTVYLIVNGLPAGNYTFTLKDSHNCSLQAGEATVGQPAKLTVSTANLVHPTCGWANGSLTATASGGIAPYIYTLKEMGINAVLQTQTSAAPVEFENIAGGNYCIVVTDKNGCSEQSAQVIFNQYTSPVINNVVVDDAVCFEETNGKITATAQAGTANINYFTLTKTSGNTTIQSAGGIFDNLPAGNYTLFVFDTNGCRSQNAYPVTVNQPDRLQIEIDTIVPVINKGTNGGKIRFRILGGNTGTVGVYLKDAGNTNIDSISTIKGFTYELPVKAGEYVLEAIDSKDCTLTSTTLQVNEPSDSLRLIIKEVKDALCKSQTGKIVVEGAGGWGDYRYKRAGSQYSTLNRFENLYPGTYLITVTDKMGATTGLSIIVYEPQDSLKAEIIHIQNPTCAANGALSIHLSGGTPPYKLFSGTGNDTIFSAQPETVQWPNLSTGALTLHLTDVNGCRFELETIIPDTTLLHLTNFEILPPDVPIVPNAPTGSIKANITGGTPPFSYHWRKIGAPTIFPNNPQITNLSSGYYELKVTDSSSCSITESLYLPGPDDLTISIVKTGDETAVNAANGYAILYSGLNLTDVRVINPENNYTDYPATTNNAAFRISNDTIYLNYLASGKWLIIGTNAAGQNAIAGFEIKPYEAFVFGKIEIIPVSVPNGADGAIRVEIQGGAGENRFVWTDEQGNILASVNDESGTQLNNLPAGKYTLTVTDRFGNIISTEIEVLAPGQALQLNISEQKNQSCHDETDAFVVLSAVGGWGNYRYAHYRQALNEKIEYHNSTIYSGLETGDHYFYAVDKYGVTATLKTTVTEPDILRANTTKIENVKCKDDVNGQITFSISGGNPPYYFKESHSTIWTKGHIASNLPAGEYTFEFTDSLQCASPDILTVIVTEPDSLLFQNIDVTHTTCGEDNGQIAVSLQGGTRPYTYQWKDSEDNITGADSIISNLKQNALYRLYVTDSNGCTQYFEQFIQASRPPKIVNVETTDVLCYGDSTGAARITAVEAGEPYAPYLFTWSNGAIGDSAGNFPAGRHSVTVSDTNNCATTYYFNISQPDSLYLLITGYREPHCFGYSDGAIETRTFGGAGNYTYLWSNGATTPNIENIPTGDYWVRVTDGNGCVFEKQFTLNEPPFQPIDLGEDITMCPGNTHVIDGGDYVSYRWFTDEGDISRERYLSVREEKRYYLEATTPDGCSAWGDIAVKIGDSALRADLLLASEAAVGDTLVIFELSNLPLDSLKWEYDPAVFERIIITDEYYDLPYVLQLRCLQTGIYNIGLAAYSGGCYSPAVKQVEITEAGDDDDDDLWGAKEPVIQSLKQYPNPTNGVFAVELELREAAEARFVIFEISSGICLDQRIATDSDYYKMEYNLTHLQTGVYVLIVTAGNERRQIKIVIE